MSKATGFKDPEYTRKKKSEAAKRRWESKRKEELDLNAPTIESCINFLYEQAQRHGLDLIPFVDAYSSTMFNAKKEIR